MASSRAALCPNQPNCGWDGVSKGCTRAGCFGPALADRWEQQAKCKHTYRLCYSTFGADQGAMCTKCWRDAPMKIYKELKIKELEEQIDRIKKL